MCRETLKMQSGDTKEAMNENKGSLAQDSVKCECLWVQQEIQLAWKHEKHVNDEKDWTSVDNKHYND